MSENQKETTETYRDNYSDIFSKNTSKSNDTKKKEN